MQHEDNGGLKDLAFRRVEVAKEDLETAKMNLKEEHYRAANNRAYYSIYHSITAVLALENVSYKRHKDTIANLSCDKGRNYATGRNSRNIIASSGRISGTEIE